ncbi:hypothetical protein OZX74_05050 [Bifidobacterium sp. ESL0798]|nr:hypothetical protein [Bifidobacterium sp. ESL0798]WEV73327.1 hypothetical protein OZX74_05050 [Bifidobacterium sp. ESL0798]
MGIFDDAKDAAKQAGDKLGKVAADVKDKATDMVDDTKKEG